MFLFFFFQAEDGIRDLYVTGVQTCALPISAARSARETGRRPAGPRLAGPPRAGARLRPRQRRPRPARGLFPRLDGHDGAPGDGLRPALRVWHVPAVDRGRLAAGAPGPLAPSPRPVGGSPPRGAGRDRPELLVRGPWRRPPC